MKKVILASVIAIALSGCAIQPAESIDALREVNSAKVKVTLAHELKAQADARVINAEIRVKEAEFELIQAKDKFEAVYQFEK